MIGAGRETPSAPVRWVLTVIVLALVAAGSLLYLAGQRGPADAFLAAQAIDGIRLVSTLDETPEQEAWPIEDIAIPVEMYFDSDSATRLPLTPDLQKAWSAQKVASEIALRTESGDSTPTVASIPRAEQLVADFPELESSVNRDGAVPRFVTADGRLVREIELIALRNAGKALETFIGLYPRFESLGSQLPTVAPDAQ